MNNLTAKFWHSLRWMNSYRVLSATIKYIPEAHPDDGNFGGEHLAFIQDLDEAAKVSSWIEIIFQKTFDRGFIPPYDAVCPTDDDGTAVEALVRGSLRPFVAGGALTEAEAAKPPTVSSLMSGCGEAPASAASCRSGCGIHGRWRFSDTASCTAGDIRGRQIFDVSKPPRPGL